MDWAWGYLWNPHSLIFSCASMNHLGSLIVPLNSVRFFIDGTSMILFFVFHCQEHWPLFLNYLNSKHSNINFTFEHESCNTLSFLDCMIHKNNNKFECSVYWKGSFTDLGMSYFSNCTFKFKLNGILTLLLRACRVCSNFNYLHMEFTFFKEYFRLNGYYSAFVETDMKVSG